MSIRIKAAWSLGLNAIVTRWTRIFLIARLTAWALILPILKRLLPLPALVSLMARVPRPTPYHPLKAARAAEQIWEFYRRRALILSPNCLERSLLTFRILCSLNAGPCLVAGFGKKQGRIVGHTWVTISGRPIIEAPELLSIYTPAMRFDAQGKLLPPHKPDAPNSKTS